MLQFIMALIVLIAVITVPTGTINLEQIDMTDGEWVAPGYEVITELDFDPLEYVDNVQAAQAFFMDTEDGEKLRLILVGDNRVLVFDEPWDNPMEYSVEPPWEIGNVVMARNGRYLAISAYKDSTYNDGYFDRETKAYADFRIEITDNNILSQRLNSNLGGYYVSNDGRISTSSSHGILSLYPLGDVEEYLSRESRQEIWKRRGCSYDGSLIVLGNIPLENGNIGIQGYDWSGNLLWETPIGDRNLTGLRVSPSGEYVLAPARDGVVVCYSGVDGSKLWETVDGLMCDFPQISPDGERWIMSPDEIGHSYFYNGMLDSSGDVSSINASEILSSTMNNPLCLNVNNYGNSLFLISNNQNRSVRRMLFLNSNHNILWASGKSQSPRFNFHQSLNIAFLNFGNEIAAISVYGNRICYTDRQSIQVLRFEEVE